MSSPHTRLAARLALPATDGDLLARFARDRDEAAFAVLVHRHGPTVLGVCRRVLGHPADAEDAFQAVFLVLAHRADLLLEHRALGGWLHGVAVRVAMQARLAVARRRKHERAAAERRPESALDPTPTEPSWIDRELSALPDKLREPVVLCLLHDRPRAEVAAELGIPEGTLASRLDAARKRLAGRLARHRVPLVLTGLLAAVPGVLADATVRRAADNTDTLIHQLANEVTRSMLTNAKWRALLAASLLTAAIGGLLLAAPTPTPMPTTRRPAPVPGPKEPPEPEWMKAFRKVYELKDGEYVKRFAPPYPDERIDFQLHPLTGKEEVDARIRADAVKNGPFYTVFVEQDGKKLSRRMVLSSVYLATMPQLRQGDNLITLWDAVTLITGREAPEVVIDPKSKDDPLFAEKNKTVHGDFVTRKGATLEQLAPQLEKIFREECQLDVTLTVKKEEQEVFVVGGKFKLSPPEWRGEAKNKIGLNMLDVYATEDGLNREFDHFDFKSGQVRRQAVQSMGYSGKPVEFVRFIGERVKTRMVWDAELPAEPKFMWHNHTVKNPTKEQEAEDCDLEKVLPNVTAQTGLTFKKEKRKVPVLVLSLRKAE